MSKPESETDPWKAIQRYEFVQTNFAYTTDHEMERDAEGEWARWEAVDAARAAEAAQHQQEMARLRALMLSDEDRIVELLAERDRLKAAFLELHATVKGECPSLLDPDRGGSDVLWALCAVALTPHQGQSTDGETR